MPRRLRPSPSSRRGEKGIEMLFCWSVWKLALSTAGRGGLRARRKMQTDGSHPLLVSTPAGPPRRRPSRRPTASSAAWPAPRPRSTAPPASAACPFARPAGAAWRSTTGAPAPVSGAFCARGTAAGLCCQRSCRWLSHAADNRPPASPLHPRRLQLPLPRPRPHALRLPGALLPAVRGAGGGA